MINRLFPGCNAAVLAVFCVLHNPAYAQSQFDTTEYQNQKGLGMINAAQAYEQGYTGRGITLGIVDSGIVPWHPEFAGKLAGGYDFNSSQAVNQTSGIDDNGHGSHVSGIMAAHRDNTGMHGVAFNATLFSTRYGYNPDEDGDDDDDDDDGITLDDGPEYAQSAKAIDFIFAKAWNYMAQQRLVVINNSLGVNDCKLRTSGDTNRPCNINDFGLSTHGGYTGSFNADTLFGGTVGAFRNLKAAGTLMVFATGNEGQPHPDFLGGAPVLFPDLKDNWLAVASVDADTGQLSFFSNKCGDARSWCLSAPGSILSDEINIKNNKGIASVGNKGDYTRKSGTSMAAPHVTGAVALTKEAFPFFTAYHLQQTLLTTATDLTPGDGRRFDATYGWGLLNAGKAVRGPGLFVSTFDVDTQGYNATFSNDIGDLFADPENPLQRGSLIKRGAGTLTLSGINSYTGSTTLEGGTLIVAGINNTGNTYVNGGEMIVNGTLAPRSTTTVNTAGTLRGSGNVGTLVNKGTVAPGNSIGTLNILGDYTATAGSVLAVEVEGNSAYDILNVAGTATLDAGSVLLLEGGPFRQGVSYDIVRAPTVTNNGLRIDSSLVFLTPGVIPGAGGAGLSVAVTRSATPFARYTETANQTAVAQGLDRHSASPPAALSALYDELLNGGTNHFAGKMDQLSGEAHASVQSALFNQTTLWANTSAQRINGLFSAAPSAHKPMWVSIQREWADMNDNDGTASARTRTNGFYLGGDFALNNDTFIGAALGYHDGRTQIDDLNSRANTDSYTVALYGAKRWSTADGNAIHWRASGAWTRHDIDMQRSNITAGGNQTLSADYTGQQMQAYTEVGYALPVSTTTALEPFGRLGWTHQRTGSFSETGGPAALHSKRQTNTITTLTLGVRSYSEFSITPDTLLRLNGEIGWRRANGDLTPQRDMQFDSWRDARFTVSGNPVSRNALQVALNGEIDLGKQAALGLNYTGQFGHGTTRNAGSLYLNVRF